ncbi:MAG TPA: DUF1698 domain-containing protein [Mycobacteriales bacterium]|nr:DUF1698 domain-containing protein [Mycobacteriales bacterium]
MTDPAALREAAAGISWYHRMPLSNGFVTDGHNDVLRNLGRLHLPESFAGREVLDVGAWDGFYSFEAKRRGAKRVLATDSYAWSSSGLNSKAGFMLAREDLGLDVEDREIDVMNLSPQEIGSFDDVLFLGVLYHLRDPLTALERVASVCRQRLILETETSLTWLRRPATEIYYGGRLNADGTNFYAPNPAALRDILERLGFAQVRVVYRTPLRYRLARAAAHRLRGKSWGEAIRSHRLVIHAIRATNDGS